MNSPFKLQMSELHLNIRIYFLSLTVTVVNDLVSGLVTDGDMDRDNRLCSRDKNQTQKADVQHTDRIYLGASVHG